MRAESQVTDTPVHAFHAVPASGFQSELISSLENPPLLPVFSGQLSIPRHSALNPPCRLTPQTLNQMTLEEFVSVVNSLPEQDGNLNWGSEWQSVLNVRCPDWKQTARDQGNWPILEKDLRPRCNRDKLFIALCNVVGSGLANRWISSSDRDAVTAAQNWFGDHLRGFKDFCEEGRRWAAQAAEGRKIHASDITTELWGYLPSGTKHQFIETHWEWIERAQFVAFFDSFGLHALGATRSEIDEYCRFFLGFYGRSFRNLEDEIRMIRSRIAKFIGAGAGPLPVPVPPEVALGRIFQRPGFFITVESENILSMITDSKDFESLKLWKLLDEKSRQRWEKPPTRWIPVYDYSDEIPNNLKSWLQKKQEILSPGAILPEWPSIVISEDDPPVFVQDPAMKRLYEEDQDMYVDLAPDFESLLGCYFSKQKKIVLWRKGIDFCARRMGLGPNRQTLPVDKLIRCVLVHELGHWFCDVAVVPSGSDWDPREIEVKIEGHVEDVGYLPQGDQTTLKGTAWSLSSRSFHEMWAQWFAWLYGHEVDTGVLEVFVALEKRQSKPYQAWRKLVSKDLDPDAGPYSLADLRFSQEEILKSLDWARMLRDDTGDPIPATFDDTNFPNTNLLDHLMS